MSQINHFKYTESKSNFPVGPYFLMMLRTKQGITFLKKTAT